MKKRWLASVAAGIAVLGVYGLTPSRAQEPEGTADARPAAGQQYTVDHSECTFFGAERERFNPPPSNQSGFAAGRLTREFTSMAVHSPRRGRSPAFGNNNASSTNLIDKYIWQDLQAHNVTPAEKTTDWEFVRRVYLDLTGRIPTPSQALQFAYSAAPDKRAALIDQLLATPEWIDKWTMYYGDLFKNTAATVQIQIRPEGRNAFYKWIHSSLATNKPYNQMATELIAAQGNNSFDQANGQMNWLALGYVTGGPSQDIFDSQAANVADTFLGLAHVNCILCHNGRGHLDSLSLWGSQATRTQAWGLAAFMAHTWTRSLTFPVDPNATNPVANYNYWSLDVYKTDYNLNTTTGNRPARQPIGAGATAIKTITPVYMFNGAKPAAGQDYRSELAKFVTGDFQFARASVNYIWAQFFGVGIVDPPDQFDLARLDPNNPPPAPWTLQPSNAALLNALAQHFIDSGYNIRDLMRLITTSDTYQLASDVSTWEPSWDKYFGRKFVRRLWGEEIHDSIVTAINTLPVYTVPGFSNDSTVYGANSPGFGKISFAMQAPDVVNMPDGGGAVSQFLDTFLRGNRDDAPRKGEGSILQALGLMNDNFVQSRIHVTGTAAANNLSFLSKIYTQDDNTLIDTLFLSVLSRYPADSERVISKTLLDTGGAASRKTNAEDLLWTLFNKVDFTFNY